MDISWPCYCAVLLSKYTKDIVLQDSLPEIINPEPLEVTTRPYTLAEVACEWAGAVMIKAYPSIWAGAVTQKPPVTPKKLTRTDGRTDRPT